MVISSSPSCAASTAVDRSWHHTWHLSFYSPHIDMKPTIFSPKYTICPLKLMHLIWNFFIWQKYSLLPPFVVTNIFFWFCHTMVGIKAYSWVTLQRSLEGVSKNKNYLSTKAMMWLDAIIQVVLVALRLHLQGKTERNMQKQDLHWNPCSSQKTL